jgi:hypothetical protein
MIIFTILSVNTNLKKKIPKLGIIALLIMILLIERLLSLYWRLKFIFRR